MEVHALDSLVNPHAMDNLTFVYFIFSNLQPKKTTLFTPREILILINANYLKGTKDNSRTNLHITMRSYLKTLKSRTADISNSFSSNIRIK